MTRPFITCVLALVTVAVLSSPARAQAVIPEQLCDPQLQNCRDKLVQLIRAETQLIDVAFWFMEDARYVQELVNRKNAGVRVRILVDQKANRTKRLNETILNMLRDNGFQMRENIGTDILHFKTMIFHGQGMVEFSKANYTDASFNPISPTNFFDEAIFFTDDTRIVDSFKKRFDDLWVNTTRYRNFTPTVTEPLIRECPTCTIHASMNFSPLQDYSNRSVGRYNAEANLPATANRGIDAIEYRLTDDRHANAMINAVAKGVPVRVISEPEEYRDPVRPYVSKHMDRMWAGGVQIKMRKHEGLTHEASVIMHGLGEVIFGSSNWTTASASYQDEHNFFYNPSLNKPWFFQWFADQFERKWNETENYEPFTPLPPTVPSYIAPADGASGLGTTVELRWDGGSWSHLTDIEIGTSPTTMTKVVTNWEASNYCSVIAPPCGSPQLNEVERYPISGLSPGTTYYWRITGKTFANLTKSGPIRSFTTAGTPPGGGGDATLPFSGAPFAVPGTFQAEDFDNPGTQLAFVDTTAGNSGGVYRSTDVDLQATTDSGGGYNLMKTRAGEWVKYTVNVGATGTYKLEARVANVGTGVKFHVEVDGVDRTGPVTVPDTGGWQVWQTITTSGISLDAGTRVIRVVFDTNGASGGNANYNWFSLVASETTHPTTPYGGTPAPASSPVQAENFDIGAAGVAIHDTTAGNSGGAYRSTDVDLEATTDTGGGYSLMKTRAGEWLKYTVDVATTGTYTFQARVASVGTGAKFHVEVDGVDKTGQITLPDTGGWQAWQTISVPGVSLDAGTHIVRLVIDTNGTSGGNGNFNWFQFVP